MKKTITHFMLLLGGTFSLTSVLRAEQWKPDEQAAVFSIQPNQVFESSYFKEVLKTYGLIGFAYSSLINDHHLVDLQKEMGIQIKDAREFSLVVGNFLENMLNMPVSTSGNYDALNRASLMMILRIKGEVLPDTFFKKFDRWASGPAFHPSDIERFRKNGRIESDKIEQMSKAHRIKRELYAGLEKSEKVGKSTLFAIPVNVFDTSPVNELFDELPICLGMQTENGETTFALGSRDGVVGFFEYENKKTQASHNPNTDKFASFSIPMDGGILKNLENSKLSDPNGPFGPLVTILGEAIYQIREISGNSKIVGDKAHIDLTVACADTESAQAIWSVAQASLGMAQLAAMRQQMKNPQNQAMLPLSFLTKIKLKNEGNQVYAHFEALPTELFPWAVSKKFP